MAKVPKTSPFYMYNKVLKFSFWINTEIEFICFLGLKEKRRKVEWQLVQASLTETHHKITSKMTKSFKIFSISSLP